MRKRKKLPEETVDSACRALDEQERAEPGREQPGHAAASDAPRRRCRRSAPTRAGARSRSTRAGCWRCRAGCAQSRSTYRSTLGTLTATIAPAASRVSSSANAGSEPSPRSFHTASVSKRGQQREPERQQRPQVAREQRGDERRGDEETVRRLHADREADHQPRGDAVERGAGLERAHEEQGPDEQEHHRLEVGEAGEAEGTGQELLDVALVVVVAPEWDHGERQHHPDRGGRRARTRVRRSCAPRP